MATITPATKETMSKMTPKDSKKRKCIDAGGTWNEETQTCDMRKEADTNKIPKGNEVIIKDKEGVKRVQTPQTLAEDKRLIEVQTAKQEAMASGQLSAQQAIERNKQDAAIKEEQKRMETEESPIRPKLDPIVDAGLGGDPQAIGGEQFPIIGPLGTFMKRLVNKNRENYKAYFPELGEGMEDFTDGLNEQQLMEIGLLGIENAPTRELSASENTGQFIEALSLGDLSNFVAEKPAENVRTIIKSLRVLKTRSTDAEMKVKRGTWSQTKANAEIDLIDEELNQALYDLKLLIQNSPEYKFNSDGVNYIESKIYEAQSRNFDAKLAILEGKTSDPTEIQVLMDLQQAINTESYDF